MLCKAFVRCAARALLIASASSAFAQLPLIYNRSVYNAASFMPAGIPAGAVARGSIFSVFGRNLGPTTGVSANAFPLGTTLSGVSLAVIQGNARVSAIPVYVSAGQINAIMPSNAPLGIASMQVTVGNFKSNLSTVRVAASAFGIFTALGTGLGPGILQNFISQTNQPINSPTISAQGGQVITLWGTGLGAVLSGGDNAMPPAGNLPVKTEVFVGGVSAPVLYSGRTPCCAGTDQVVFTVPNNAPTGCWVPVYVRTGGTTVSNFVSMAINQDPTTCTTDVLPQVSSAFINGTRIGEAIAVRTTTRQDIGVTTPVDVTSDYHVSFAFEPNVVPYPFNPALAFPPSGTCTAYTHFGDLLDSSPLPGIVPTTMPLDYGGAMMLTGPNGTKTLTPSFTGANVSYLGGSISNSILPSSLFLDPGSYSLSTLGSMDILKFTVNYNIPQPLTWSNRNTLSGVDRTQPLMLSWTGGDPSQTVAIIGFGIDLPTNSSAVFVCIAPPGSSSFAVPPDVLSNLPATRKNPLRSKGVIYLMSLAGSSVQNFGTTGLDVGFASFYSIIGKTVVFQ